MNANDFLKKADEEFEDNLHEDWRKERPKEDRFGLREDYFEELVAAAAKEVYAESGAIKALRFVKEDSGLNLLDAQQFVEHNMTVISTRLM